MDIPQNYSQSLILTVHVCEADGLSSLVTILKLCIYSFSEQTLLPSQSFRYVADYLAPTELLEEFTVGEGPAEGKCHTRGLRLSVQKAQAIMGTGKSVTQSIGIAPMKAS